MKDYFATWYVGERDRLGKNPLDVVRLVRKQYMIGVLGGSCQFCGYSKCIRNLAFHHVLPGEKAILLNSRNFQYKLDKVLEEVRKCVLVCHNCHGEIHDNLTSEDVVAHKVRDVLACTARLIGKTWGDLGLGWKQAAAEARSIIRG